MSSTLRSLAAGMMLLIVPGLAPAQTAAPAATKSRAHLEYLAGERLKGRMTGSEGERLAAEYIISELKEIGAVPHPDYPDYLQPFEFTAGAKPKDGGNEVFLTVTDDKGIKTERNFSPNTGFAPLSFSGNGTVEGPVVFAGYGIQTRPDDNFPYDNYQGLDVKGKIVLVFRYSPEDVEEDIARKLDRQAPLRQKAITARNNGAKAVLILSGPRSETAGEVIETKFDVGGASMDIVALSVSGDIGKALFDAAGKNPEEIQKDLDTGNPHAMGFEIPNVTLRIKAELEKQKVTGHNILAILPATHKDDLTTDIIAMGAHYDHLGDGKGGGSLAKVGELGQTHYGADDNASGTSAVLAAARMIAETSAERRRDILVGFWSGEELGLLGSEHFTKKVDIGGRPISAYVNLDMVGRMKDNTLTIQGLGSSPDWAAHLEKANVPVGFNVVTEDDPYQPTDSASFYGAKVPALEFFTGLHLDYHRPTDTADKIAYEELDRVAQFTAGLVLQLARADSSLAYAKWARKGPRGQRGGMRAYTGTVPDYTREVNGMAIADVVAGGPADKAGLKAGDIIVQLGPATVTNIYDFMYALDRIKVGEPNDVIIERDGKRMTLSITPTRRE